MSKTGSRVIYRADSPADNQGEREKHEVAQPGEERRPGEEPHDMVGRDTLWNKRLRFSLELCPHDPNLICSRGI
jgi:hypothetical protein